jgi:hypothetical protein
MQEQCNRDGYCALPVEHWKQSYDDQCEEIYHMRSPGLVSFSVVLTFKQPAPSANTPSSSMDPTKKHNQTQSVPTFKKYLHSTWSDIWRTSTTVSMAGLDYRSLRVGMVFPRKPCRHSHSISEYDLGQSMLSGKRFFTKERIKFILRRVILPLLYF